MTIRMVRGDAMRVTELNRWGSVPVPAKVVVSECVIAVRATETTSTVGDQINRTEDGTDVPRLVEQGRTDFIGMSLDIEFIGTHPSTLSLVSSEVQPVLDESGAVVGFETIPRRSRKEKRFALEVSTKMAGSQGYGYLLFPHLRNGVVSAPTINNGVINFTLRGATTIRNPRWGSGPHDLEGEFQRHVDAVSRNTTVRSSITTARRLSGEGVEEIHDVVDGGGANAPTALSRLDGEFVDTSPWIFDGGRAV